jgi:hypothetical protein
MLPALSCVNLILPDFIFFDLKYLIPKIDQIRRLIGTYIFCKGLIKYSIRFFSSNTHVARVAKRKVSILEIIFLNFQKMKTANFKSPLPIVASSIQTP